jgi:hypothetical protein
MPARHVPLSGAMLAAFAGNGCSKGSEEDSSSPADERQTVIRVGEYEYISALLSVVDVLPGNDAIAPMLSLTGFKDNVGLRQSPAIKWQPRASLEHPSTNQFLRSRTVPLRLG